MSSTEMDKAGLHQLVSAVLHAPDFIRATFGGALRNKVSCQWVRVVVRPVELRGERHLQFSYFDKTQNVTKNDRVEDIDPRLDEILDVGFARIHLATNAEEWDVQTTKKSKIQLSRRRLATIISEPEQAHNRIKQVPLPEGKADHVLEAMNILTRDGKVRPTMRAKYTQINELLKLLAHVLEDAGLRSLGRPVEILDCGCGLSYLALAVHHYLNDVLAIPARVLGVDVNEDLIRKSVERSELLGAGGLTFACGPIGALDAKPDLVLALHACDTATDDALALAVGAEAKLLLSVPCCHHQLNDELHPEGGAAVLRPLFRHGILKQRTADIITDTFRALALRIMGYKTDVIEFISPEHTARNLMIRAVRGAPLGEIAFVNEYLEMRRFWRVVPYIERVLGEPFQRLFHSFSREPPTSAAPRSPEARG